MRLLIRWVLNAGALLLIAYYLPGVGVTGWYAALVAILVLGLVNAIIRPLLILLTLPVNILSLGLFTFVINASLFWLVSTVIEGFEVSGFWAAFWGALVMTITSWIIGSILKKN